MVVTGLSDEQLKEVKRAVPEVEIIAASKEELTGKVVQADALVWTCDSKAIRAGKKLRWV